MQVKIHTAPTYMAITMEKGNLVRDILPDMDIAGIFIIVNPALLPSRNGVYWRFSLADATGSVEGKIWPPKSLEYPEMPGGRPALAKGRSLQYRDQLQIRVEQLRYLTEEEAQEIDPVNFLPVSKRDIDSMMRELRDLAQKEFQHPAWRRLFLSVFADPDIERCFRTSPAARNIHHAWIGGLLEHTLSVATLCMSLADTYPELDRQTLLAGAIFHDLGKIREFSSEFAIEYTDEGQLAGHGYLGLEILLPHFRKSGLEPYLAEHLKHLILSHHGLPEYGAAKLPHTREAFILHFADNIDARMTQCKGIFENEKISQGEWSSWQKSLDRKVFNSRRTPGKNDPQDKKLLEESCLSLLRE